MKGHLAIVITAVLFSTIGVIVKLIGTEVPFMTLNFLRVFFGFIFLLIFVPFLDKNTFKVTKRDLRDYFVVGALVAVTTCLYTVSFLLAPVHNVTLINSVIPFFVFIFAYFLLKEQITKTKIITLIIALIGLVIIDPFDFGGSFLGNMVSLVHAWFFALLLIEMRKEDKTHSIGDVVWFFFFAVLLLLPIPFIFGFGNLINVLPLVLFLGVVSTGVAYLFYNLSLEKVEAEEASIIETITIPLVSIFLAVIIINEEINSRTILGGIILVFAGIYLETHKKKLKQT